MFGVRFGKHMSFVAFIKSKVPILMPSYQPMVLWDVNLTSNIACCGSEVKPFCTTIVTCLSVSVSLEV